MPQENTSLNVTIPSDQARIAVALDQNPSLRAMNMLDLAATAGVSVPTAIHATASYCHMVRRASQGVKPGLYRCPEIAGKISPLLTTDQAMARFSSLAAPNADSASPIALAPRAAPPAPSLGGPNLVFDTSPSTPGSAWPAWLPSPMRARRAPSPPLYPPPSKTSAPPSLAPSGTSLRFDDMGGGDNDGSMIFSDAGGLFDDDGGGGLFGGGGDPGGGGNVTKAAEGGGEGDPGGGGGIVYGGAQQAQATGDENWQAYRDTPGGYIPIGDGGQPTPPGAGPPNPGPGPAPAPPVAPAPDQGGGTGTIVVVGLLALAAVLFLKKKKKKKG
jgi:hypothetical protein